jgi:hypothetical protein
MLRREFLKFLAGLPFAGLIPGIKEKALTPQDWYLNTKTKWNIIARKIDIINNKSFKKNNTIKYFGYDPNGLLAKLNQKFRWGIFVYGKPKSISGGWRVIENTENVEYWVSCKWKNFERKYIIECEHKVFWKGVTKFQNYYHGNPHEPPHCGSVENPNPKNLFKVTWFSITPDKSIKRVSQLVK